MRSKILCLTPEVLDAVDSIERLAGGFPTDLHRQQFMRRCIYWACIELASREGTDTASGPTGQTSLQVLPDPRKVA